MKPLMTFIFLVAAGVSASAQTANDLVGTGNQFYKQTQFPQAEAEYRSALQMEPGHSVAKYNLANALQKQKKYDEAAQLLEQLYGTAPDKGLKSSTAYNQGVAFTKQKKLDESIESYKKALRLNPDDQQARENLQKALAEKKKNESQQQQQKSSSNMDQKQADQKLKLLQDKERQLQQRLQSQKKTQGGGQGKDW